MAEKRTRGSSGRREDERSDGADPCLPQDLDAERAVLGAILLDNCALHQVVGLLQTSDFLLHSHRCIFSCMLALSEQ